MEHSIDIEKVIKGIDICLQRFHCGEDCPYYNDAKSGCMEQLREDALALLKEQQEEIENLKQTAQSMMEGVCLLKEQEAVKVQYTAMGGLRYGACPQCNARIDNLVNPKACGFCGQELKWK